MGALSDGSLEAGGKVQHPCIALAVEPLTLRQRWGTPLGENQGDHSPKRGQGDFNKCLLKKRFLEGCFHSSKSRGMVRQIPPPFTGDCTKGGKGIC